MPREDVVDVCAVRILVNAGQAVPGYALLMMAVGTDGKQHALADAKVVLPFAGGVPNNFTHVEFPP